MNDKSMLIKKKSIFLLVQVISISRALSGLLFVCIAFREELHIYSSVLFFYACISDFIDGYLARKYSCTSHPGQVLDLFGDKFLTIASTLYAVARNMPIIPISFIVFREVFLLAMRSINTDQTKIFKPQRTLGGLTVIPIWVTTFLLLQYPIIIHIDIFYFFLIYWICGIIVIINLMYKLIKNWNALINVFKKYI